ncbi:alkaline phosphatase D family protein [Actinomycetes bacterium M1A6_2h]
MSDHSLSRRGFLRTSSIAAGVGVVATLPATANAAGAFFRHGVASGDPTPDAVILWTRLTPTDDAIPGSGRGPDAAVGWAVSTNAAMSSVVASGSVIASAESDHTVKIDVTGLAPATTYYYRFTSGGQSSPVGTTHTAPANDADVERMRFGVVSCSNWESGYFGAYRHLAQRTDLDAIIHLGDYIYEYKTGGFAGKYGVIRPHDPLHEIVTLADYRIRHAQYKTDPDLQAAHLGVPWICTLDDHESANDSYDGGAENHQPATEGDWATRKSNSAQAYYEWMPVRAAGSSTNRHLYRRLRFGNLMELSMLDLRTYRSKQVMPYEGREVDSPNRTITGAEQMSWLTGGLVSSPTQWKIVGNPVMITPTLIPPLDPQTTAAVTQFLGLPAAGVSYNADPWDGYTADRKKLLDALRTNNIDNTVFITGDIHSSWACDLPVDAANYPAAGTVATELVVTSVTSSNIDDFTKTPEHTVGRVAEEAFKALNRHVKYVDLDTHGYGVFEVSKTAAQMDHWYLTAKEDKNSGIYLGASYRVESGSQRVVPAAPL